MTPSIADTFRGVVASAPDAVALATARERFTYADLDRWSDAIAADVIAQNPPVDKAVAIVTADNVALVAAVLGVVKAGRFFVMIDASDPEDRVDWILRESGAALRLEPGPFPRTPVAPPIAPPNDFVHLVFTSGTTGKPKGILTRHTGFVEKTVTSSKNKGFAAGERTLYTALPGFTRAPLNIFGALLTGGTMCAFDARSESLAALAGYIRQERITTLGLTPSLFRRLMTLPDLDLSSVRTLRLGADRVTIADVELFKERFPRGCALQTGFASTEAGRVFQTRIDHDTAIPGPLVPMGRVLSGVEVRLIDDDGHDVAEGQAGELIVTSDQVAEGYWNDPELTARSFVLGDDVRTFRTGDLVRRDDQGLYYFVGRKDARLKIHGRRIDPSEIEAAILTAGPVREAVVVGKDDGRGEQRLVAYVVMRDGVACDTRALRAALREKLPGWMVPGRIHAVDAMPVTRAGKADHLALMARDEPGHDDDGGARDELQRQLVAIWSEVVGAAVHVDDDFFEDLGGESIVAAHLVSQVQRVMGAHIPLSLLLELNTVAKMASFLRGRSEVDPVAVVVQSGGTRPPLFCISGAGGSVMVFRRLARSLGREQPFYGLHHHGFGPEVFPQSYTAMAAQYADAIRRMQPQGPYFVAGYSSGGTLAFEVARQMERAGETVAFVGLIDAGASRERASPETRLRNRLEFLRQRPFPRVPHYVWEMLARRPWFRLKQWARRSGKKIRLGAKDFLPDPALVPAALHETNSAMSSARRGFALQPYGGRVTLFRARHGVGAITEERDLGWTRIGIGHLDIRDVEGDHRSILEEDVRSLGNAFAHALAEAQK